MVVHSTSGLTIKTFNRRVEQLRLKISLEKTRHGFGKGQSAGREEESGQQLGSVLGVSALRSLVGSVANQTQQQ